MPRKKIDVTKKPTEEQLRMLREVEATTIEYDEDCLELTEEELSRFRRISDDAMRNEYDFSKGTKNSYYDKYR
jgi:hypothetical protein